MSIITKVFKDIFNDFMSYFSLRTKLGRRHTVVVMLVVVLVLVFLRGDEEVASETVRETYVEVASIVSFTGGDTLTLIGQVDTLRSADLRAEVGGRVTAVPVTLGQSVQAGTVLATFENAAQYAALLQAQGTYEAAVAGAAASDISLEQAQSSYTTAQTTAVSSVRNAYTTVSNTFYSTLDTLYWQPSSPMPNVMVGGGYAQTLNSERATFSDILPAWQRSAEALLPTPAIADDLRSAKTYTTRTIALVDTFIAALNARSGDELNGTSVTTWISTLSGIRASLNGTLAGLEAAESGLVSAQENVRRAEISGTNSVVSAANAQVKQALGSLKAAEAAYAKTIVRSPIAGVVNGVSVKVGEYVNTLAPVASITNDSAYEVVVYVNEADVTRVFVGQEVALGSTATGTVAEVAPGIDQATGKFMVKVQTTAAGLVTGSQVAVTFRETEEMTPVLVPATLFVPIAAVRFEGTDGSVFILTEDSHIAAVPVGIGRISGGLVELIDGVTADMEIITDVRGLTIGQAVVKRD